MRVITQRRKMKWSSRSTLPITAKEERQPNHVLVRPTEKVGSIGCATKLVWSTEKFKTKSWFNKDYVTISLLNCCFFFSFFLFSLDTVPGCQKCSSRTPAQTTSGWLVREMMDRVYIILDHTHIAGLNSIPLVPPALFIILAPSVPTVEPTPEHNPLFGTNPKTYGR